MLHHRIAKPRIGYATSLELLLCPCLDIGLAVVAFGSFDEVHPVASFTNIAAISTDLGMVFLRSNQSWASHLGGHERLVGLGGHRCALYFFLATISLIRLAILTGLGHRIAYANLEMMITLPTSCYAFCRHQG